MKILRIIGLSFIISPLFISEAHAQRLTVENATVECGRTGFEQPITATFELKNKGHKRLVIESVKPD